MDGIDFDTVKYHFELWHIKNLNHKEDGCWQTSLIQVTSEQKQILKV